MILPCRDLDLSTPSIALKNAIKNSLFQLFPRAATEFFSARARAYSQNLAKELGCIDLNRKLIRKLGNQVLHGPFAGVVLSPEAEREHLGPFLLGSFESELHPTWEILLKNHYDLLIDVGAKFGYYAIGLAKRYPHSRVIGFDTDPWARKAMTEMCAANQVGVDICSFCSPEWLRDHLPEGAFIFSDCEGYEKTLFGAMDIPALSSATMVIEIHEQASPGVTEVIRKKFSNSHDITVIDSQRHTEGAFPEIEGFEEQERQLALNEYRTFEQCWLCLTPKKLRTVRQRPEPAAPLTHRYYLELAPFLQEFRTGRAVLLYHKIGFPKLQDRNKGLYISPRLFEKQLKELKAAGFTSRDLDPASAAPNTLAITFDDGYQSTFRRSSELLAQNGFKAIQFISSSFVGKCSAWDADAEPLMDEVQIREWLQAGHSIGSHSATHPRLTTISREQAREEIISSRKCLEDQFGVPIEHFCYPYGDWNEQIADLVAEAGYVTASTSDSGMNTLSTNPFALRRLHAYAPLRKLKGLYYFLRR